MKLRKRSRRKIILIGGLMLGSLLVVVAIIGAMSGPVLSAQAPSGQASWDVEFVETFESGISPEWTVSDGNDNTDGQYYWATTAYTASEGTSSAWATGGGADGGALTAGSDNYPNNALSYMVRDSVNLSGTTNVRLSFDYLVQTEPSFDIMQVAASTDGATYDTLATYSGDSDGWQSETLDLGDYADEEEVWIRFFFSSNGATNDVGAFVDNIVLESLTAQLTYFPVVRKDPTPTPTHTPTPTMTPSPTPTPTTPPFHYYDDFTDSDSGWPVVDNTHVHDDCFEWYYEAGEYRSNICDDRTDVKVSPLVDLPSGDYSMEVEARFRSTPGDRWWTSYGIMFDAKDEPNPNLPDLGDYYMIWVLWQGSGEHLWKILKDVPGDQLDVTEWTPLSSSVYNYGSSGTEWNTWRIERTSSRIRVYVNDHQLADVSESRPTTNNQTLFGLFSSTYETNANRVAFNDVLIDYLNGPSAPWTGTPQPFYQSGDGMELSPLLPQRQD